MNKCSTEKKKIYVGFDVSEKTIEVFAVCGTETSKGYCKIDNNQDAIKKFLSEFKDPCKTRNCAAGYCRNRVEYQQTYHRDME